MSRVKVIVPGSSVEVEVESDSPLAKRWAPVEKPKPRRSTKAASKEK